MPRSSKKKTNRSSKKNQHQNQKSPVRPQISNLSLVVVPEDAVEGYQERIETGIEWTVLEEAAREHKKYCQEAEIPSRTFSEALQRKLEASIIGGFLDDNSKISPEEYLETIVNIHLWEQEKIADRKQKICFLSKNSIINDIEKLIKKAVKQGERKTFRKELINTSFLRLNNAKITELDGALRSYENLEHLVLCCNFIRNLPGEYLPRHIKILELQANGISDIESLLHLDQKYFYLGLSRNLLCDGSVSAFSSISHTLTILDLGDNDINSLTLVLDALAILPSLISLTLAGNPCSVCAGYSIVTFRALPNLKWLDNRKVLEIDKKPPLLPKQQPPEIHPHDLRSAWFVFKVLRIMSTPQPPKAEKGTTESFQVELEIPLLDSKRRNFLMYHDNKHLLEYPPTPEDNSDSDRTKPTITYQPTATELVSEESYGSHIYKRLEPKVSQIILNYKVFESNKVQWHNIMTFQDPTVRIFCPDLVTLRDTFRSVITVRFVYNLTTTSKATKGKSETHKPVSEYRVVLATVKCALKCPDWSQKAQYFHWDDSMGTDEALHWGDGDLEILQYASTQTKVPKPQKYIEQVPKQQIPENLTCHFSFGIERLN